MIQFAIRIYIEFANAGFMQLVFFHQVMDLRCVQMCNNKPYLRFQVAWCSFGYHAGRLSWVVVE